MKKNLLYALFCLVFIINNQFLAQNIDSLKVALKDVKHDTIRCRLLNAITEVTLDDSIMHIYNEELFTCVEKNLGANGINLQEKGFYKKFLACALNNKGYLAERSGEVNKALEFHQNALKISEEIGFKEGISASSSNLGLIYRSQGNMPLALNYFIKSLKIEEENDDKLGMGISLNSIGSVYMSQNDFSKALEYFEKSLKIKTEVNDKRGISYCLNNEALIYRSQKKFTKAIEYFEKSLKIAEEINDEKGIGNILNNIGLIYYSQNNFIKAKDYYLRSLNIRENIGDKSGISNSLNNIGNILLAQKNYSEALKICSRAMKISHELGYANLIMSSASLLSKIYKKTGDHKLALENYELYIEVRDSLNNIEKQKETIKQQFQFDFEKKKAIDDKIHETELITQNEKAEGNKKRQNIIISSISIVLLLLIIFSTLLYNRFKITQNQKLVIEKKEQEARQQKYLVEEKNKEITDSINYAERIQRSFLASSELLDQYLKDYFIFFKPKDVVSGDFYWAASVNTKNRNIFYLATADSTGHGVPGAIMSLLNITSLEKAIEHITNPADILDHTRQTIITRLKKDGSSEGGKDGMDCSLLAFDFANKKLQIAAAHNPVWIVRSSSDSIMKELIEIKPDKIPVGKHDKDKEPFTLHTIDLQKGDVIYTLTDGFPDQFGGEKGKKFMSKNLREFLVANSNLPMTEQKHLLETTFNDWKGDLQQVDDVTILGIRI